jgi:FkbM family methyltransferase
METALKILLKEDPRKIRERERRTFMLSAAPFDERAAVLFGCGGLGQKTLAGLKELGVKPLAFADNAPGTWGRRIGGLRVFSPEEAAGKFGKNAVFVVTIWGAHCRHRFEKTQAQLKKLGCLRVVSFVPLFWKYPDLFLPYYCLDLPHKILPQARNIQRAFALWEDPPSRGEYLAQLKWRLGLDFGGLRRPACGPAYFSPKNIFPRRPWKLWVDCGAYDGDTLRDFLKARDFSQGEILAFEPDPENFRRLETYLRRLPETRRNRISGKCVAVGRRTGKTRFDALGGLDSRVSSDGRREVECVCLDGELPSRPPDFIKMDIEGAEGDALLGARKVIGKGRSILAVSVYHRQDHLWRLPLMIRSFSKQYRFYLRRYAEECWDTVCYAIPANASRR